MQERKKAMEKAIAAMVEEFESITGVTIGDSVWIRRVDITDNSDFPRRRYLITARTEAAL